MMKKVIIVYNQSLKEVQGINYVNNSFVEGQKYFEQKGYVLTYIVSPNEVFDCKGKHNLDLIGCNISTASYKRERKLRTFLRVLLSSKYLLGASIKYYFNHIRTAKKAIENLYRLNEEYDYIIFQDSMTANIYFNTTDEADRKKNILILHCSKDPCEQMRPQFPALFNRKKWESRIYANLNSVFSNIGKVIYLSQRAVDHSPVAPDKKTYIFNGEEDLADHAFVESGDVINCVSVASMSWHKGHEFVLEAMTKLPKEVLNKIKYHMIGAGPQMQELKDYVASHNLEDNVVFYGNRNDVPELLKGMDVFILPSKSEGLPMSIIEALRQGMYLVATDTGAIPEMIAPGCGELVERNADQIADCLARIVKDGMVTMEVKKKAREHYLENFTLKNMIYKYCDVLSKI